MVNYWPKLAIFQSAEKSLEEAKKLGLQR